MRIFTEHIGEKFRLRRGKDKRIFTLTALIGTNNVLLVGRNGEQRIEKVTEIAPLFWHLPKNKVLCP